MQLHACRVGHLAHCAGLPGRLSARRDFEHAACAEIAILKGKQFHQV